MGETSSMIGYELEQKLDGCLEDKGRRKSPGIIREAFDDLCTLL